MSGGEGHARHLHAPSLKQHGQEAVTMYRMAREAEALLEGPLRRANWSAITRDAVAEFLADLVAREMAPNHKIHVAGSRRRWRERP